MISSARPTPEEQELLFQHFRKPQFEIIRERAHVVLLSFKGYSPYEIAQVLFRDEETVREWIKAFNLLRLSSLFPRYRNNQNAAKLTREQKEEIKKVLSLPPSDYGLPKQFWEVKSLRTYIKAEFGVEYESDNSYRFIFKLHNYSFHLPAKFSCRRNENLIKKKIQEIREKITPLRVNPRWAVLAADESRLIWEAIIRRAWLPKGEKTVIKVIRDRQYQNFIGFLNLRTGLPHLFTLSWQNQKEIIRALKKLGKCYPNKRICLIWDNARWHRGRLLKGELKTSLRKFYLVNLPPYAPDTNPEEHIWKYAKDQVANEQYRSMMQLVKAFRRIIMGRNYPYQI